MNVTPSNIALRTALSYAVLAGAWIFLSDLFLEHAISNLTLLSTLQTYKGWFFVALTALLLYIALQKQLNTLEREQRQRREAEKSLSLFRSLIDRSNDAIEVIEPTSGRLLDVNERACLDLGYTRNELLAMSVFDLDSTVDRTSFERRSEEIKRTGGMLWEGLHHRKDGSTFPVEVNITNVTLDREYIVAVVRNTTERTRTMDLLRLQTAALNAAANAIIITDREGTIQWVNPAFTTLTGYSSSEALGKNPRDLVRSDKQDLAFYKNMWDTILAGRIWYGELINRRKDNTLYIEQQTITPVRNQHGGVSHFIAIKQDITHHREIEESKRLLEMQLQQAQKLESLGTLASGIAHDFNNILGIIIGHAALLERIPTEPDIIRKNAEAISRTGLRGANLVKQMLTFARKTEVHLEPVILNDVVEEVMRLLTETFPKTILIDLLLEPNLPAIEADTTQLHQVIINLCVNARDAMPEGGTLTIRTYHQTDKETPPRIVKKGAHRYAVLDVRDTGMGMDEATRERIFEPFFSTKGHGKGTGLGLSLVFGIMDSHGGFVDVQSERGKGATFRCYFPIPKEPILAERTGSSYNETVEGGNETILIVEDEEMLRELVRAFLEAKGYRILVASDGEEGLDLFRRYREPIHLVISDLGLPKFGGDELYQRLKALDPRVRVILGSGYIEPQKKTDILKEGVKEFIQKPYNPNEVLHTIRRVLDKS
jgi:two-component system cell cycle sensor histidine kinase/response regulator CckA